MNCHTISDIYTVKIDIVGRRKEGRKEKEKERKKMEEGRKKKRRKNS